MNEKKLTLKEISTSEELMAVSQVIKKTWLDTYKNIVPKSWLSSLDESYWQDEIKNSSLKHLIAVYDSQVVGIIAYSSIKPTLNETGEISSFYILPEYHGQGIGSQMIERVENELKNLGYQHLQLWVAEENHPAINFYEKRGWKKSGELLTQNISGQNVNVIRLVK